MPKPILFYDADCGFCEKSVHLLRRLKGNEAIETQALQDQLATEHQLLERFPNTVVLWTRDAAEPEFLGKSQAVLATCRRLQSGWPWLARFAVLIPRFLRDGLYDLVAQNRHRFGSPSCKLK